VIEVHVNRSDFEEEYLRHLNLAYGSWGDRRQFDWYFKRETAYPLPDLIALTVAGRLVAGAGVSYRNVVLPTDRKISVGIITGAWTLPEFRNQGYFARAIRECARVSGERTAALLLGFVRAENASSRQLFRLGFAMFPTWYLRSGPADSHMALPTDFAPAPINSEVLETLFARVQAEGAGHLRFGYANASDFWAQFTCRPAATEIVADRKGNYGVLEKRADAAVLHLISAHSNEPEYLQNLLTSLRNYARLQNREILSFTTLAAISIAARAANFEVRDGFLGVLIANEACWQAQAATELPAASRHLAAPDSRFFLGAWNVHGGDRL